VAGVRPAAAQPASEVINQVRFDQHINAQLPLDARFRDEAGNDVRLADYFGRKPVIVAFVYYDCPMLCNLILNGLVRALKPVKFDAGEEFEVVVISFDPRETPRLAADKRETYLREYGRAGAERGWHFLTGEERAIRAVTGTAGFEYLYDPATDEFAHASGVLVATPEGKLYRYFYGIEYSSRDLRFALVEASANKIGTAVDQMLLFCFHYDPTTGKYGVLITNILRLAGGATALALAAFMLTMFLRDRRQTLAARSSGAHS
jgi:protein SCO1/2